MQVPLSDARKKQEKCLNCCLSEFIAWTFAKGNLTVKLAVWEFLGFSPPQKSIYSPYKIFHALFMSKLKF